LLVQPPALAGHPIFNFGFDLSVLFSSKVHTYFSLSLLLLTVNGGYSHCNLMSDNNVVDMEMANSLGPLCRQNLLSHSGNSFAREHLLPCERLLQVNAADSTTLCMNGSHTTQHIKQECLGDYKGLSEVSAHREITDGMELKGSGGLHLEVDHNSFTNSLSSQLFNNEHSPSLGSLSLNSPHHSGRQQTSNLKKRCISVLPSSADGIDITTIIRTSQTSLVTCVNGLWTNSAGDCDHSPMQHTGENKLNFLKQEPLDEYTSASSLFQHHQELPPPYHLHEQQNHVQGSLQMSEGDEQEASGDKQICRWIDCSAVYDQQDELVRHIEKTHIDQRKGEDFTCFWTGCIRRYKPFNARYKLLIHMRVHSGEKPNKCMFEGCNKAFSRLENLKIHLRSHTGEKPYLCQHPGCQKAFSNSSDRAKHQRTHLDTKPYACQIPGCSKRYTDPSSLRKHVKAHSAKEQQMRKKLYSYSDAEQEILSECLTMQQLHPSSQHILDGKCGRSMSHHDLITGMYTSSSTNHNGPSPGLLPPHQNVLSRQHILESALTSAHHHVSSIGSDGEGICPTSGAEPPRICPTSLIHHIFLTWDFVCYQGSFHSIQNCFHYGDCYRTMDSSFSNDVLSGESHCCNPLRQNGYHILSAPVASTGYEVISEAECISEEVINGTEENNGFFQNGTFDHCLNHIPPIYTDT
uniref:GLIS family zinc finger 1 n=1 Tax=Pseudonaja textilis TaxID=8673 RepID=A0A670XSM2_PSETE